MSISSASQLKVYRPPVASTVLGAVCSGGFFVVGLSMVTIGPSQLDGASSVVVGALTILLAIWLWAVLATNRLIVTRPGLVYYSYLRRRVVGWG